MDQQKKLHQLSDALQGVWADLKLTPSYAEPAEPIEPREDEIYFTFTLEGEELADQFIRAARRTLASFGPEYWLPDSHPLAAQFLQGGHIQFKVRKSLIVSHLNWGVSFTLCGAGEGYSLVEDTQP